MLKKLASYPRIVRQGMLLLLDVLIVAVSVWAAFAMRLGDWWPRWFENVFWIVPLSVVIAIPVFLALGFYRSAMRYAGMQVLYRVVQGVSLSILLVMAVWVLSKAPHVPRSTWVINWFVMIALLGGSRMLLRDLLRSRKRRGAGNRRVVIYGAGSAGVQLATALQHTSEYIPAGFVDDSPELQGTSISGLDVFAPDRLSGLVEKKGVDTVLLAMPSASRSRRREILVSLESLPVHVMAMPGFNELASGTIRVEDLREVGLEDVLGRDPVAPSEELLNASVKGKSVLVTGAGGSIGSELCRQILRLKPSHLILLDHSEYALYAVEQELSGLLKKSQGDSKLVAMLGSVTQRKRMQRIMESFGVDTVYHAAAYKHVPIVEHNPIEGIRNNIFGTLHCARAAIGAGVERFVLVSTDKAVRPTNVMGATKRFAELVLQSFAAENSETCFSMVRFGNVLASSGSVVPLFREQIRGGGPVTVTHEDIVRYFMTIPEAAQLVIQAGSMGKGGDVFVLDMGEPVKIVDLARRMIRLSGLEVKDAENPNGDIEIEFSGLRPGEKLYEELLIGEADEATDHPMIRRAQEESLHRDQIDVFLNSLDQASREFDYPLARKTLLDAVRGYEPECDIEDWLWLEHQGREHGIQLQPLAAGGP